MARETYGQRVHRHNGKRIEGEMDRRRDRQKERQTKGQTDINIVGLMYRGKDRWTDNLTHKQMERKTDKWTEKHRHRWTG